MFQLLTTTPFDFEIGCDQDTIRVVEQRVGVASTKQIEQVLAERPNATLIEIYLVIAQQQAQKRLGNA
jgi:hypothetical protein